MADFVWTVSKTLLLFSVFADVSVQRSVLLQRQEEYLG